MMQDAVSVLRDVFAENVPIYVSAVTELELFRIFRP